MELTTTNPLQNKNPMYSEMLSQNMWDNFFTAIVINNQANALLDGVDALENVWNHKPTPLQQ